MAVGTFVASLGMYDLPELRDATDRLWQRIAQGLRARGIDGVPDTLCRDRPLPEIWRDPDLLLAQTCGAPYVTGLKHHVRLVGTPTYDATGCGAGTYSSAIIVARGRPLRQLADLVGQTVAVNDLGSHSGAVAFRAALAPLASGAGDPIVSRVMITGSHRESVRAVGRGDAAAAAIDAVTLALLRDLAPAEAAAVDIVAWTQGAPALPFVSAIGRREDELRILSDVLGAVLVAPDMSDVRRSLRLRSVTRASAADYRKIESMITIGRRLGDWGALTGMC